MNTQIHDHGENDPIEFELTDAYKTVAKFAWLNIRANIELRNEQDKRREDLRLERELGL